MLTSCRDPRKATCSCHFNSKSQPAASRHIYTACTAHQDWPSAASTMITCNARRRHNGAHAHTTTLSFVSTWPARCITQADCPVWLCFEALLNSSSTRSRLVSTRDNPAQTCSAWTAVTAMVDALCMHTLHDTITATICCKPHTSGALPRPWPAVTLTTPTQCHVHQLGEGGNSRQREREREWQRARAGGRR